MQLLIDSLVRSTRNIRNKLGIATKAGEQIQKSLYNQMKKIKYS